MLDALLEPQIWDDDRIEVPVLVVVPRHAPLRSDGEALVRRLAPRLEYHVWDDASHFLMLERAEAFNALVADFARRIDENRI